MAREFRVDPRAPLTWTYADFYNALQLLTEERLGKLVRAQKRQEDGAFHDAKAELR